MKLSYLEDFDSQIPAIQLLGTFGWSYPFVVIECKRRDKDNQAGQKQIEAAIEQQIRNQKTEWISSPLHLRTTPDRHQRQ